MLVFTVVFSGPFCAPRVVGVCSNLANASDMIAAEGKRCSVPDWYMQVIQSRLNAPVTP